MALPNISLLKSSAMICIAFVHMALLNMLYHFHPSNRVIAYSSMPLAQEQVTQISFITRSKPKPQQIQKAARTPETTLANAAIGLQVEFKERQASEVQTNTNTNKNLEPLNLSLPEVAIDFSPKPPDLLERAKNPIDYQATRFNGSWKPSGNAVDALKWKSKTFNFITGILGGNQRLCTDDDRKNRLPDCVPEDYQPED